MNCSVLIHSKPLRQTEFHTPTFLIHVLQQANRRICEKRMTQGFEHTYVEAGLT